MSSLFGRPHPSLSEREKPGPGQESVWDFPRPPAVEQSGQLVTISHDGRELARSTRVFRVKETSHPPTIYIPPADIDMSLLTPTHRRSMCEFKGQAQYWDLHIGDIHVPDVAWSYAQPWAGFEMLRDTLAFYASKLDHCTYAGETVVRQEGDFYGGWITSHVVGPFKGTAGTLGW